MKDLDYKFRKNKISLDELIKLRQNLGKMTDAEFEELLSYSWLDEEIDTTGVGDEKMEKIKRRIDTIIEHEQRRIPLFPRIIRVVAAVLLPIFIISTFYLYRENNRFVSEELVVSTGKSERANITLPDGTQVSLNSESRLSYIPKLFNEEERKISFKGEAYFNVHKNKEKTFIIDVRGMQVKVLGTKFNLSVKELGSTAELSLEEGSVLLQSVLKGKEVIIKPSQKAILNQQTGDITVIDEENIEDASAWRKGDMVFRNTILANVIKTVEENYNVKIVINCNDCLDDQFTGIIPNSNLNEVLEIIEKAYHLRAAINGNEIVLTAL